MPRDHYRNWSLTTLRLAAATLVVNQNTKSKHPWNNFSAPSPKPSKGTKSSPSSRYGATQYVLGIRAARRRKSCITSIYFMNASRRCIRPAHPRSANALGAYRSRLLLRGANLLGSRSSSNTTDHQFLASRYKGVTRRKDALCGTLFTDSYISSAQLHDHAACASRFIGGEVWWWR